MDQPCGTHSSNARAARPDPTRRAVLCALALMAVVVGACTGARPASAQGPSPQPQKLWRAYPLDTHPSRQVRARAPARPQRAAPPPKRASSSRTDWSWAVWAGCVLVALATIAAALVRLGGVSGAALAASPRRRRPSRPQPV